MASGDPAPTAKDAGNGGGCNDQYPPDSNWGNDWWNRDGDGRYWNGWGDGNGYFDGSSSDSGCGGYGSAAGAQAAAAGKVSRVMVAAKRLRGPRCQTVYRSGRLSHTGSCSNTHWMRANGTSSWRLSIPRSLPRGHYRLLRHAVDAAGNRERTHRFHLSIR